MPLRAPPPDPLPACDVIVVADPSGVSASRTGPGGDWAFRGGPETVEATLRIRRVVKGNLQAGAAVKVAWRELPTGLGNRGFNLAPNGRSLWLLKKTAAKGRFSPVELELGPVRVMDAPQYFYLPLPAGDLPAEFLYRAGDTADAKLARELGFALEALAQSEGDRLNEVRVREPSGAVIIHSTMAKLLFDRTAALFSQVRPAEALPVLQRFAASPLLVLQSLGNAGLLRLEN
jgi:hypothetical protein